MDNEQIIKIWGVLFFAFSLVLGKSWEQHFYVTYHLQNILKTTSRTCVFSDSKLKGRGLFWMGAELLRIYCKTQGLNDLA